MPKKLTEQDRIKLDGIVQQMVSNGETDDDIKFVVEDFKGKYGVDEVLDTPSPEVKKKETTIPTTPLQPKTEYPLASGLSSGSIPQLPTQSTPTVQSNGQSPKSGIRSFYEEQFKKVKETPITEKKSVIKEIATTQLGFTPTDEQIDKQLEKDPSKFDKNIAGYKAKTFRDNKVANSSVDELIAERESKYQQYKDNKDLLANYQQSREGKVAEFINDVKEGRRISDEDFAYIDKYANKATKELFASGEQFNQDYPIQNINTIADQNKQKLESQNREQNYQALNNTVNFLAPIIGEGKLGTPEVTQSIDEIRKQMEQEIQLANKKYTPNINTNVKSESFGAIIPNIEQENEIRGIKDKYNSLTQSVANAQAFEFTRKNPNTTPLEVGLEWMKIKDPSSYTNYVTGSMRSIEVQKNATKIGISIMESSGDKNQIEKAEIAKNIFETNFPDELRDETIRRLAIERLKEQGGTSSIYNKPFMDIEESDKYANQLPQKYKDFYYNVIRKDAIKSAKNTGYDYRGLDVSGRKPYIEMPSQGGIVNEFFAGFATPFVGTVKTIGGLFESKEDKANRALQPTPIEEQKLIERSAIKSELKELESKPKLTIKEINRRNDLQEQLELKSASQVVADGIFGLAGQVAGQATATMALSPIMSTGLKTVGLGVRGAGYVNKAEKIAEYAGNIKNSTNIAGSVTAYVSSYDDARMEAERLMPNGSEIEKLAYASSVASLNALTERIFKDEKIFDAFKKEISPELQVLVKKLSSGKITEDAFQSSFKKLVTNTATKYIPNVIIENQKETFEEVLTQAGTTSAKILGIATGSIDERDFNMGDEIDALKQVYIETTISGIGTSMLAGRTETRRNNISQKALYEFANDPTQIQKFIDVINYQQQQGQITQGEAIDKVKSANTLQDIASKVIPNVETKKPLNSREKVSLTNLFFAKRKLTHDIETDPDTKKLSESQLAIVDKKINDILLGEVVVDSNFDVYTEEEYNKKLQEEKANTPQGIGVVEVDGKFTVNNPNGTKETFDTRELADARVVELSNPQNISNNATQNPQTTSTESTATIGQNELPQTETTVTEDVTTTEIEQPKPISAKLDGKDVTIEKTESGYTYTRPNGFEIEVTEDEHLQNISDNSLKIDESKAGVSSKDDVKALTTTDTPTAETATKSQFDENVRQQVVNFHDGLNPKNTTIEAKENRKGKFNPKLSNGKSDYILAGVEFDTQEEANNYISEILSPQIAQIQNKLDDEALATTDTPTAETATNETDTPTVSSEGVSGSALKDVEEDSEKWYKAKKTIKDKDGNDIKLTIDKNKDDKHFYIKATDSNGKEVGSALFETSDGEVWSGNEIEVNEANRRKGIMSAMYDFAESEGHPLEPTKTLSKEGKAFWDNRKAPTQYTEAATPKDDSAIQSGGEQKLPDQKEVPIEQKQEEVTPTTETNPNVEAKKADIERRRQENPSVERGVLINYESGKTKEQLIDIVNKLKNGEINLNEIIKEFFNLPINTLSEVKEAFKEGTLADKIQFGLDTNELSDLQPKTRSRESIINAKQKALFQKQKTEEALKDSEYKTVKKTDPITGKVTETKVKRTAEEKTKYDDFHKKALEDVNKEIEKYDAELKELENNNPTLPTNETEQTTVAGEQSVSTDVEGKKADIERRRQEELKKPIENFKNAKNKEELIKAGQDWIGVNPYDNADSPMNVRAALLTQGGFEKGKDLFIDFFQKANEIRDKQINAKYDAELATLEETSGVSGSALKDVESTAKALEGVKFNANFNLPLEQTKSPKQVSEAYHKAKADGSNPELVKAVEDLLGKANTQYTEAATPKEEVEGVSGSALKDVEEDIVITKDNYKEYLDYLRDGGKLSPMDLIDLRVELGKVHRKEQDDLYEKVNKEGGKIDDAYVYSKNLNSEGRKLGAKQNEEMNLVVNQPNSYGLAGDINAPIAYHFTDPMSILNILDDNSLYGDGEVSGVSTTTNRALGHPESTNVQQYGEGNKPLTFADKGIRIDLDLQKLKNDGIKIRIGNENLGTFEGEEELKIGGYDGIKDLNKYIKQIEVDKKILDEEPVTSAYHVSFEDIKKAAEKHGIKVVEKTDYERPRNKRTKPIPQALATNTVEGKAETPKSQTKNTENEKQQPNEGNIDQDGNIRSEPKNQGELAKIENEIARIEENIAEREREEGITTGKVAVADIIVQPKTFQFKATDETESGVNKTEKLQGTYDRNVGGTISVWKDTKNELGNGANKIYVVDGHHRLDLAKRSGTKDLDVFFIEAETAKDARLAGARANIAQGRGTSIDSAKIFRESPDKMGSLKPNSKVGKEGEALSKLNDNVFELVATGKLPIKVGIALSQVDKKYQTEIAPIVNKFANNPIATQDKLNRYARKVQEAIQSGNAEVKEIQTLFGAETQVDIQNSAIVESEIINAIKNDARLFSSVKNNKEVLENANNQIDVETATEESEKAKKSAGLFDTFRTRKSVSDIYNKAVADYKNAKTSKQKSDIISKASTQVKDAIQKELDSNFETQKKSDLKQKVNANSNNILGDYDGIFSTTKTGISGLDDLLEDDGYNYFYKGKGGEVVMMSPDDYLKRVREGMKLDKDKNITDEKKQGINKAIDEGNKINMPFLSYRDGNFSQEGRNRAVVAKERGEKLIPVFIEKDISFNDKIAKGKEYINTAINEGATTKQEVLDKLKKQGLHRDAIRFIDDNFDTNDILKQVTNEEGTNKATSKPKKSISKEAFTALTNMLKKAFPKVKFIDEVRAREILDGTNGNINLEIIHFLKTENGQVFGFQSGDEIFLDPELMNADTPIHEVVGHYGINIIDALSRGGDAKATAVMLKGFALLKEPEGKAVLDEVQANPAYANLPLRKQKLEALATIIGREGASVFDEGTKGVDGMETLEERIADRVYKDPNTSSRWRIKGNNYTYSSKKEASRAVESEYKRDVFAREQSAKNLDATQPTNTFQSKVKAFINSFYEYIKSKLPTLKDKSIEDIGKMDNKEFIRAIIGDAFRGEIVADNETLSGDINFSIESNSNTPISDKNKKVIEGLVQDIKEGKRTEQEVRDLINDNPKSWVDKFTPYLDLQLSQLNDIEYQKALAKYEEIKAIKSEKVRKNELLKIINDNFDTITETLIKNNKIKRIC